MTGDEVPGRGPDGGPPRAAFFDVDETLVAVKTMHRFLEFYWQALGRPRREFADAVARFRASAAGGQSRGEANRAYYRLFAGHRVDEVERYGRAWFLAENGAGFWNASGLEAFRLHRARGHLTVLVSGSFPPCLEPIAAYLNADALLCSRPDSVGGRYTGELPIPIIGRAKADAARELMVRHRIDPQDCHTYGDHISDLPLLEQVGHPVVVGRDPALIRHARPLGWTCID
ncbi:HAD family hydrolase [Streptacidiphilus sp. EB103A]|uniref:HAD family hydrolase n=1 Tax=Streptacidiphilus sp. EB103A TaxID=3156275 RepID=UPI003517BC6A